MFIGRRKTIAIKILIVDDEEIILEEARETLTDEGYECFVAISVEAAIEIIETTPGLRLIITDLKMPKVSGANLIKFIETTCVQDIKIIVMSGHASPDVESEGIDLTPYTFLKKPLDINDLIDKVGSVLAIKEY